MTLFFFSGLQKFASQYPPWSLWLSAGNTNNRHSNEMSEIISEAGERITGILRGTSSRCHEPSSIMCPACAQGGIKQSREVVFLTALLAVECFLIFGCFVALWWAYGGLLKTTEAGSGPIKLRPEQMNHFLYWVRKKPVGSSVTSLKLADWLKFGVWPDKKKKEKNKAQSVVNYFFPFAVNHISI